MMIHTTNRNWLYRGILCLALMGLVSLMAVGQSSAQDQEAAAAQAAVSVGTYDAQAAFEAYPGRDAMIQELQTAGAELQTAQQQNDQARVAQLQQQLRETQEETVKAFYTDVEEALPAVANMSDVTVIAENVVYTADSVNVKDVTPLIADMISEGEGEIPAGQGIQLQP